MTPPLTWNEALEKARAAVEQIRRDRGDPEAAHSMEDDLREWVLEFLAHWSGDPLVGQELAQIALSTREIDFPRWCA